MLCGEISATTTRRAANFEERGAEERCTCAAVKRSAEIIASISGPRISLAYGGEPLASTCLYDQHAVVAVVGRLLGPEVLKFGGPALSFESDVGTARKRHFEILISFVKVFFFQKL
jgi:hypothetical protein